MRFWSTERQGRNGTRGNEQRERDPSSWPSPLSEGEKEVAAEHSERFSSGRSGFTLVEMLVVLVIIGLLLSVALPGIKGMKRTNVMANANRQLLDDLALARQKAIVGRTTVHVVFVPTNVFTLNVSAFPKNVRDKVELLKEGVFSSYAIFAERTVGDQPGTPNFKYLTEWKGLPDGVFIRPIEFDPNIAPEDWKNLFPIENRGLMHLLLPFPNSDGIKTEVPQIAFGPHGGLVDDKGNRLLDDEIIELTRGSIFFDKDASGSVYGADMKEQPPVFDKYEDRNWIRIDGLTGRAKVDRKEIQ